MSEKTRIVMENTIIRLTSQIESLKFSLAVSDKKLENFDAAVKGRTQILQSEIGTLKRKLATNIKTLASPTPMSIELLRQPASISALLDERMEYFAKMQEETVRALVAEARTSCNVRDYKRFVQDFELGSKWSVWKRRNK